MSNASVYYLDDVALAVLQGINTPTALKCWLLIEHGEWDQFRDFSVDPSHYLDAESYYLDAQCVAMFTKCEPPADFARQTRDAAEQAFHDAEKHCFQTNRRLDPFLHNGPFEGPEDMVIYDFLVEVRTLISEVLGPVPPDLTACKFGKGATFDDRGQSATLMHKMQSRPTVTVSARALLPLWERTAWARALVAELPYRSDPSTVPGNRFATVPKNIKTDRGINVECSLNLWFQLGVGRHFRRCLARVGIDLENGQARHRHVAEVASVTGEDATIDFSQASDLWATNAVKILFPSNWMDILLCLRSPKTRFGNGKHSKWILQEKLSSMGNGFTFEVETLLFWAVAKALQNRYPALGLERDPMVYGDDVIVPTRLAAPLLSILKFLGCKPNEKKTFTNGVFRESCGGDYLDGQAVRPYFRKNIANEPQEWISMANGLRAAASQFYSDVTKSPLREAYLCCLSHLPSSIRRLRGPVSLGDLVIHTADPAGWCVRDCSSISVTVTTVNPDGSFCSGERQVFTRPYMREIRVWRPISGRIPLQRTSPLQQLALALYGVPSDGLAPRGYVSGYRFDWITLLE